MRRPPLVSAIAGVVLFAVTIGMAEAICEEPPIRAATELAQAINAYDAHMGHLPSNLEVLTAGVTNAQGVSAGPFMPRWGAWRRFGYEPTGRMFRITTRFIGGHLTLIRQKGSYDIEVEREWCGAP